MIPLLLVSIFGAFLFFSLFILQVTHGEADEVAERIAKNLRPDEKEKTKVRLEKNINLSQLPFLDRLLRRFYPAKMIQAWITQAGLRFSPGVFLLMSLLLAALPAVIGLSLKIPVLMTAAAGTACALFPAFYIHTRRLRRQKQFAQGFPDAVARMASSLRAGYSIQMALEALVEDSGSIIAEEFRKMLAEMEVGQSFEAAIQKMLERVDTPDLRLFIASILIQRESGGNLAELLDNLEGTIRERFALRKELEAATAQAKLSGLVLSFLPIFVGLFIFFIHRDYIMFFFSDPTGKNIFWVCVAGQLMGIYAIRKIVRIEM